MTDLTDEIDTNTDRLHVDVLLTDHYPNHDRYCPDHHYHQQHDDHCGRHDHCDRHRCCRHHDPASSRAGKPNDREEDADE